MNRSVLLVVLSVTFGIIIVEGFLVWRPEFQALDPSPDYLFCAGPSERGMPHELFGWIAPPESAFFERKSEADGWAVHIRNADGFRDLFNSGTEHVIVLGDSFTEGTLVSNDETFSYLLDLWNPNLAFHNFGTAGYGTKQSLSVYETLAPGIPHKLLILAYFLGNDLHDNLERYPDQDERPSPETDHRNTWYDALKEFNSRVRQLRTYNLLYTSVRSAFGRQNLSDEEIAEGAQITSDLLNELAGKSVANDADFLILILPSWNQMNGYDDLKEAARQRSILDQVAGDWDNVYLLDLADIIARNGTKRVYGIKDKHFSRYGHYLAATAVHDWINFEWQQGPRPGRQAPPFRPPNAPIDPDCAWIPKYRENFRHPHRGAA